MMMEIFYVLTLLMCVLMVSIFIIYILVNRHTTRGSWLDNQPKSGNKRLKSSYIPETHMIPNTTLPIYYRRELIPQRRIYSEISRRKVFLCCYNAARLNDRYCVCGRGILYPILTN